MSVNTTAYQQITKALANEDVTLVAVSKIKPASDIRALYDLGQRDFGENYVQELIEKQTALPADIRWHFIGHLQSNKVKYIAPFVHLIQGVDSFNLLKEINKQATKNKRVIECLLQVHIAQETTKFGLDEQELQSLLEQSAMLEHIQISGLMGMASFSEDPGQLQQEFQQLKRLFDQMQTVKALNLKPTILSMGMSGDYQMAVAEGSTMVRIGSLLFGSRG